LAQGHRNPEHRSRLKTFIAVACGTEDPAAAEATRWGIQRAVCRSWSVCDQLGGGV